jgi:hypothetical protein
MWTSASSRYARRPALAAGHWYPLMADETPAGWGGGGGAAQAELSEATDGVGGAFEVSGAATRVLLAAGHTTPHAVAAATHSAAAARRRVDGVDKSWPRALLDAGVCDVVRDWWLRAHNPNTPGGLRVLTF